MLRWAIIIFSIIWFPTCLYHVSTNQWDFPIFYLAGKGIFLDTYLYAEKLRWFFVPFAWLPFASAFALFYSVLVFTWLGMSRLLERKLGTLAGGVITVLSFYPMSICLQYGQIVPIMAILACSFPGALLAGCFKSYMFAFAIVHAFIYWRNLNTNQRRRKRKMANKHA